jgi:DedD protein
MATGTQMAAKDTDQVRDTEITLSTGKLLGIFFALAIICGVFFTMGYLLGKSTSAGGRTEIVATVPSSNAAGKPYAGNKTPEVVMQTCAPGSPNCAPPSKRRNLLINNPRPSNPSAAKHQTRALPNLQALM